MQSFINLSTLDYIILCTALAATLIWAINSALFIVVWKMVDKSNKSSLYLLSLIVVSLSILLTELFRSYMTIVGLNIDSILALSSHLLLLCAGIVLFIMLNGKARVNKEIVIDDKIKEALDKIKETVEKESVIRAQKIIDLASVVAKKLAVDAEVIRLNTKIQLDKEAEDIRNKLLEIVAKKEE